MRGENSQFSPTLPPALFSRYTPEWQLVSDRAGSSNGTAREVVGSNPGRDTYSDRASRGSQSLRVNIAMMHMLHHNHFLPDRFNLIIYRWLYRAWIAQPG
jgi:hypothetical protein